MGFSLFFTYYSQHKDAIANAPFKVYRVKIAGSSWYMADKEGHCLYKL